MTGVTEQELPATSIGQFLDDLASAAPAPGGGAATALVGATAAALVSMVANLTIGRPRYVAVDAAMRSILDKAEASRRDLTRIADDDARAYAGVAAAYRLRVAKFWERQWRKLNPGAGGQLSISKLRSATRHEQMIIEFALKAPGILEWLADVCMPQGSDLIEADDFATVMDLVRRSALRRDLQVGL